VSRPAGNDFAWRSLAVQILDHARQHGRVTMGETIRISGCEPQYAAEALSQPGGEAAPDAPRHWQRLLVCTALMQI
jgi:hypothetical protein